MGTEIVIEARYCNNIGAEELVFSSISMFVLQRVTSNAGVGRGCCLTEPRDATTILWPRLQPIMALRNNHCQTI
jgi:hypothetical protein